MMHPMQKRELWHAQAVLLIAILLQLSVTGALRVGPKYFVAVLELLLVIVIGFTAPRRHTRTGGSHKTLSVILIGLISIANAAQLFLLTKALIHGATLPGKALLSGALAIFLTNIIVFGLWYWELDSPGLSGRHGQNVPPHFDFPQHESMHESIRNWEPSFFDYLYVSITNGSAFSPTDTMPLNHIAKSLMSIQALISLITVVLVTARAVNILG